MIQMNERIPGTRVRHLGNQETWQIVECRCSLCRMGEHVAVNETANPFATMDGPPPYRWRHIATKILECVEEPATQASPA